MAWTIAGRGSRRNTDSNLTPRLASDLTVTVAKAARTVTRTAAVPLEQRRSAIAVAEAARRGAAGAALPAARGGGRAALPGARAGAALSRTGAGAGAGAGKPGGAGDPSPRSESLMISDSTPGLASVSHQASFRGRIFFLVCVGLGLLQRHL